VGGGHAQPASVMSKKKRRRRNRVKKVTAADIVYSSTELVHLGLKERFQQQLMRPSI
jgi:hypothetical protein